MARNKFEEVQCDPIEAEANRNLARQVSQAGVPTPMTVAVGNTVAKDGPINTDEPAPTTKETVKDFAFVVPKKEALARPERKQKKRAFSCVTSDQDSELDGFMLRIEEAARTHVPFQVMMRAACMAMMGAEEQILAEMRKNPPPSCPATFAHAQYAQLRNIGPK